MEAAISSLLPRPGAVSKRRRELLARLDEYANAVIREARKLGAVLPNSAECDRALVWLLRPVFICGHHRSGTTLLQNLLDAHPQLLSLPSEATYFSSFRYVARGTPSERDMDCFAAEWIGRFVDPNFEPHFRLGLSDANGNPAVDFVRALFGWNEVLQGRVPRRFAPLLALAAAFKAVAAPASEPRSWVEKTPKNERYVPRFADFECARFLHLVRDPRATLASLREIYGTAPLANFDDIAAARAIARSLGLARRNASRLEQVYLIVRYEDLVENSAEQIDRIARFLGIMPHEALLVPTVGGQEVSANSSFDKHSAGSIIPLRPPVFLSGEQLALLGAYSGKEAHIHGYDLPVPGAAQRVVLRLRHWPRRMIRLARALTRAARVRIR